MQPEHFEHTCQLTVDHSPLPAPLSELQVQGLLSSAVARAPFTRGSTWTIEWWHSGANGTSASDDLPTAKAYCRGVEVRTAVRDEGGGRFSLSGACGDAYNAGVLTLRLPLTSSSPRRASVIFFFTLISTLSVPEFKLAPKKLYKIKAVSPKLSITKPKFMPTPAPPVRKRKTPNPHTPAPSILISPDLSPIFEESESPRSQTSTLAAFPPTRIPSFGAPAVLRSASSHAPTSKTYHPSPARAKSLPSPAPTNYHPYTRSSSSSSQASGFKSHHTVNASPARSHQPYHPRTSHESSSQELYYDPTLAQDLTALHADSAALDSSTDSLPRKATLLEEALGQVSERLPLGDVVRYLGKKLETEGISARDRVGVAVARVKAVDKLEMERRVGLGEEIRHLKMGFDVKNEDVQMG